MADVVFVLTVVAFFAVAALYVRGLDRMIGDAADEPAEPVRPVEASR